MERILVFGASTSSTSINVRLARYAAGLMKGVEVDLLDLREFEMPLFSVDKERNEGIPEAAHRFKDRVRRADGLVISFSEHNGSYTAAFKNTFDWASRVEKNMWLDKPMLALATSPGKRGARSVLDHVLRDLPHRHAEIVGHFSLPLFRENFSDREGITDPELRAGLEAEVERFMARLRGNN